MATTRLNLTILGLLGSIVCLLHHRLILRAYVYVYSIDSFLFNYFILDFLLASGSLMVDGYFLSSCWVILESIYFLKLDMFS